MKRLFRPSIQEIVNDPHKASDGDIAWLKDQATDPEADPLEAFCAWQACARVAATNPKWSGLLDQVLRFRANRTSEPPLAQTG